MANNLFHFPNSIANIINVYLPIKKSIRGCVEGKFIFTFQSSRLNWGELNWALFIWRGSGFYSVLAPVCIKADINLHCILQLWKRAWGFSKTHVAMLWNNKNDNKLAMQRSWILYLFLHFFWFTRICFLCAEREKNSITALLSRSIDL